MKILQRYILRELLGPIGLGIVVFTLVFLITQLFRLADLLLNSGVPASLAGEMILSLLPDILSITIPMSTLLGILLGVGRLSADRELLAIRTSGINLATLFIPVLILAGITAGLLVWLNQNIVPFLNLKSADLKTQIAFTILASLPPNQPFTLETGEDGPANTFVYESRDPETQRMKGVVIHTRQDPQAAENKQQEDRLKKEIDRLQRRKDKQSAAEIERHRRQLEKLTQLRQVDEALIMAEVGDMSANLSEQMISITLTSGTLNVVNPAETASNDLVRFDSLVKNIFPNVGKMDEGEFRKKAREMVAAELKEEIRTESQARKRNPLIVEWYRRQSIPLACIAFALIGIPLAVYTRPTGKAVAFGISFLLILIYYGLLNFGLQIGKSGSALAPWAIFFPNVLLAAVGAVLMYRVVMR